MKIDTQGMSYGDGKGSGKSLEEQRAAIPPADKHELNLISDALKVELKKLINEVLDERSWSHVPSVEMLDSIEIYNAGDYDGNIDLK
ncbi:MAG: hypothetical protein CM15mP113_0050 [Pseudomonadota bacterium]|jgi:hypothetical protein|nr:MAG: hypothetical protein CM15mP113_0050 [Pseudomonadota bacterium]